MNTEEVTKILKERHCTGAYGNAHFVMAPGTFREFKRVTTIKNESNNAVYINQNYGLGAYNSFVFGITIIFDDTLRSNYWELRDMHTGQVLREGTF